MEIKEELIEWINLEKRYKNLYEEISEIKKKKNKIKEKIINLSESLNLDNRIIKLNEYRFSFVENKSFQPLTFKFLEECLNDVINEKEQINLLVNYIKSKRRIIINKDIKEFI